LATAAEPKADGAGTQSASTGQAPVGYQGVSDRPVVSEQIDGVGDDAKHTGEYKWPRWPSGVLHTCTWQKVDELTLALACVDSELSGANAWLKSQSNATNLKRPWQVQGSSLLRKP